ncbi:MAG: hypothetical protein ABJ201_21325, partial [Nisaea sp.]
VDKFLAAVGPSRKVEKSITVDRMASAPSEASSAPEPRAPRKPRESAPRKPRADGEAASRAPRSSSGGAEQSGRPPKRGRDMGEDRARPARDAVTQSVESAPTPTTEPNAKPDTGTAPDRKLKKPRKPKDGVSKAGAKFDKPKLGKPKFDKPRSASADGKSGKPGKPAKGKPQSKPGSGTKKPHRKGVNKPKAPWVD